MKKFLQKTLALLALCLVSMGAWADTVTFEPVTGNSVTSTPTETGIVFTNGGGLWENSSESLSFGNGNSFTISSETLTITGIAIEGENLNVFSPSVGSLNVSNQNKNANWTGSTQSVTFSVSLTGLAAFLGPFPKFKSVVVTYVAGGGSASTPWVVLTNPTNIGGVTDGVETKANGEIFNVDGAINEGNYSAVPVIDYNASALQFDSEAHTISVTYTPVYVTYTVNLINAPSDATITIDGIDGIFTDGDEVSAPKNLSATMVKAKYAGFNTSAEVTSDAINVTYAQKVNNAPWSTNFSEKNFADFLIIDNNVDGTTWTRNGEQAKYSYNSSNEADDYLILTPLNLEADKIYKVTVNAKNNGTHTELFEVVYGTSSAVSSLTNTALGVTSVARTATDYTAEFTVAEDGVYYFAIHAVSPADQDNFAINRFAIEEKVLAGSFNMSTVGYATLCLAEAWAVPTNYTASVVSGFDGDEVTLTPISNVPAGCPVILQGASATGVKVFAPETTPSAPAVNYLYGNTTSNEIDWTAEFLGMKMGLDNCKLYQLANENDKVGFYPQVEGGASIECAAHKAVLVVPADAAAASNGRLLFPGQDDVTSINAIATEKAEAIYNLQGQRVNATKAGVYVKNGKKFIVK